MKTKSRTVNKLTLCSLFCLYLFNNRAFALIDSIPRKTVVEKVVYLKLRLNNQSSATITIAPLKYNKRLAFSFTLDDGYRSAFLCAFPLLNGGKISPPLQDEWKNDEGGDGGYSDGLFYSDGCNHAVPFKLAIAINAISIKSLPLNRGNLSWPEINTLYKAGWDILNHSYHHATQHGTNYDEEVIQNVALVKNQTGFTMTHFIVPGGEGDPDYEKAYEKAALKNGSFSAGSINGPGPTFLVKDSVNLTSFVYRRDFMNSSNIPFATAKQRLSVVDSLMKLPAPRWFHEFTHGVGNSNLWSLSVVFPEFKYYMTTLAERYGSKGADNMWMAPWQEVYEYLWLRDRIQVETTQEGKEVTIKLIIPEIPPTFRYYSTSLVVKTASSFVIVSKSASLKVSSNGKGDQKLINIDLIGD